MTPHSPAETATLANHLARDAVLNVEDFGAIGDGRTHPLSDSFRTVADARAVYPHAQSLSDETDWAAIQGALDAAASGSLVYFPSTPNATFYRINRPLKIPLRNGVVLKGDGLRASQIRQMARGEDVLQVNGSWGPPSTLVNGVVVEDLNIHGNGNAPFGLRLAAVGRFRVNRCRIESCTSAGMLMDDSLIGTVTNNEFDHNVDGLRWKNGGHSSPNAIDVIGNTFENQSAVGANMNDGANGIHFAGNVVESCAKGGLYLGQDCTGITVLGNYFEQNRAVASATFDIFIGATSYAKGVVIDGNYFNGRSQGAPDDYYPVRLRFAHGIRLAHNYVNTGNRFVRFEAGGVVLHSRFGPNAFGAGRQPFNLSEFANVYAGITQSTAAANNIASVEPAVVGSSLGEVLLPAIRSKINGGAARLTLDRAAVTSDASVRYATGGVDKWAVGPSTDGRASENIQWYNIATAVMAMYLDARRDSLVTKPSAAAGAGLRLPHGKAPVSPEDGEMWTTDAGLFVRINGVTVGPLS
jgi:hypothetical protein